MPVKSATVAPGLASVKVATVTLLRGWPSVAKIGTLASGVRRASATGPDAFVRVAVAPLESVTVTVIR